MTDGNLGRAFNLATGAVSLAHVSTDSSRSTLAVFETGAALADTTTAPARRIFVGVMRYSGATANAEEIIDRVFLRAIGELYTVDRSSSAMSVAARGRRRFGASSAQTLDDLFASP